MTKKLLSILLALVVIALGIFFLRTDASAATVASGKCGSNLTWTLDNAGTLTISGTGSMSDYSYYSNAPWYSRCSSMKQVVIGDSVESIGDYAFYNCTSLTSVTIGDSVESIGESAFRDCYSLQSITIPDSVHSIGYGAFQYCTRLQSVTIPDSVQSIGQSAFRNCTSLQSITIPDSVQSIGGYAFYNCTRLQSVTIGDSVQSIGNYAFSSCDSLQSITIPDSVQSIGDAAFEDCASLTSVTIGDSVQSIGDRAFSSCTSLQNITIPDSVESIGMYAFEYCASLQSVTIGDSLQSIDKYAFYECTSLQSITIGDSVECIDEYAFYNCDNLQSVTIPDSVESIGKYAFYSCDSLQSITIGDSVQSIGNAAFYNCTSLTDVYYGRTAIKWQTISIGSSNSALTSATLHPAAIVVSAVSLKTLPQKLTYWLGESLNTAGLSLNVTDQYGLTGTVTDGFTTSGFHSNTPGTKTVTVNYQGFTDTFEVTVLFGGTCGTNVTWQITDGVLTVSGTGAMNIDVTAPWSDYADQITRVVIEDGITSIADSAFFECTQLTEVTIADTVKTIGTSAFDSCERLTAITLPASVTSIGEYAFFWCDSLQTVFYRGTEAQKNAISIDASENDALTSARWHYQVADITVEGQTIRLCRMCGNAYLPDSTAKPACNVQQLLIKQKPEKLSYLVGESLSLTGISLQAKLANGTVMDISTDLITNTQADLAAPGKKTVTLTAMGKTATFEIVVHAIDLSFTNIDSTQYPYPESAHNYSNNLSQSKTFTYPGAQSLIITFSTQTEVENNYDYIYVYDGTGKQIARYTGTTAAGKTLTIPGNTFTVKLTSDVSQTYYGYSFSNIQAQAGTGTIFHDMVAGEVTPPSGTQQGYTTYYCSYGCGYTEQRDFTDRVEADPIALKSVNIQLGSSMSLNLNGLASVLDQYENVYVIYEAAGKSPVKVSNYFLSGEGADLRYNFAYEGLTILDLNLDVTYTIYGTFDGTEYHSEPKSISMLYYCNAMIAAGHPQAAVPCANLLKYAIAAESFMAETEGHDTAKHLVNVMTTAQKSAMESYAYADSAVNVAKTSQVSNGTKIRFASQSLDMVSRITLNYTMKLRDTSLDTSKVTFKVTYTDVNGNAAHKDYTFADLIPTGAANEYMLTFSEFYATQMRQGAKCIIYIDGVEHGSYENSIENYCYTAINSASETDALKYLATRISLYGDACYNTYG